MKAELPINLCGDAASALESLQKRVVELEAKLEARQGECDAKAKIIEGLEAMKAEQDEPVAWISSDGDGCTRFHYF